MNEQCTDGSEKSQSTRRCRCNGFSGQALQHLNVSEACQTCHKPNSASFCIARARNHLAGACGD